MDEYARTLSFYEKALAIQQQSLPSNHPGLGFSYNNVANVYCMMIDYLKTCSFSERAVEIGKQSLLSNYPHLQKMKRDP